MKFHILLSIFAGAYGSPALLIPGDNSHYVEGESRYIWMPDGDGVPHFVDLEERPSEDEIQRLNARDDNYGADNEYRLFTRTNPSIAQIITINDDQSVWDSNYLYGRPIIVIAHGWNSNGDSAVNTKLTAAFLEVMEANVIVVDWSDLSSSLYWTASRGVSSVGEYLGDFLTWLVTTHGGNWNQVHLIGHSLGAHVVGNAGRRTGNLPIRITGMDPAGPNFGGNNYAMQASDGGYVECIHTDGGFLGIMDPICRANFYPNGGRHAQPGCWLSTCSHSRSYELMESTLYNNHLIGRQCSEFVSNCNGTALYMGNSLWDKNGTGWFGLETESSYPF